MEYRGLRNALSRRRVGNAEQGPVHRTARRLGALFESIIPSIKTLAEAYGRRASEIAGAGKSNRKVYHPNPTSNIRRFPRWPTNTRHEYLTQSRGSSKDGPFAGHVGFDGTSIYAAATSGSSAIAVHLLACVLARTWSGPEAIAIWVEIVKERKKDIEENTDPSQLQSLPARVAAQQNISRLDLAAWDASARAWLLSADEVQKFNWTQLRLIIKDSGLLVSSIGTTYKSVIDVWTTAMKTLQDLIIGKPQRISKGALLVGLSCWHIYPDLNVVGPLAHVRFHDELVEKGGVVTLGLQSATPGDDLGVRWSLSLSHLRYYGDPVTVSTSSGANGSRISMEDLHMIALGAVFGAWGSCITHPLVGARMIVAIKSHLGIGTDVELETRKPAFHLLWSTAKRLIECSSDIERQSNLCLLAYGRRRGQIFLPGTTDKTLRPLFGLAEPEYLWRALSADRGINSDPIEEVEKSRKIAEMCSLTHGQCVIRFLLPDKPTGMFAHTAALPISQPLRKRDSEGNSKAIQNHVCWVTDTSKLINRCLATTKIAQTLEYIDPADLVSRRSKKFLWFRVPESFTADSVQSTSGNRDQNLIFEHFIGDADRSSLFCIKGLGSKRLLLDWKIINIIEACGSIMSKLPDEVLNDTEPEHCGTRERVIQRKASPSLILRTSLENLAEAGSMYRQLPGATVSISVINVPMYSVTELSELKTRWPAQFACIAMFETGSKVLHAEQLSSILALSSGNSIYAANALLQDPLNPNLHGQQGIRRIVGNIDRPGVVMLAPPQAPLIRPDDSGAWRVINHRNFDGSLENSFP